MKQLAGRLQANSTRRPQLFDLVFIEWIRSVWTVSFPFSLELFLFCSKLLLQIFVLSNIKRLALFSLQEIYRLKQFRYISVQGPWFIFLSKALFSCVSYFQKKKCLSRSLALVMLILANTSFSPYRLFNQSSRRQAAFSVPFAVFLATCLLWSSSISSSSR